MQQWKVILPGGLFERIGARLFSEAPNESGCYLLANHYTTASGVLVIVVKKAVEPSEGSWQRQTPESIEPTSAFINQAAVEADASDSDLVFLHTHPNTMHPSTASAIDSKTDAELFANLTEILPDRPLGSLVLSRHGLTGVVFYRGRKAKISGFKKVGTTVSLVGAEESPSKRNGSAVFDRQVLAIGAAAQGTMGKLTASIVGVGGTGSALAVQIARMGVGKLVLIDDDVIEASNVSRVYGSSRRDVGRPKVDVLKAHIASFSKTGVIAVRMNVGRDDVVPLLADSDVIFSCTDNFSSRSVLNDVSLQYTIPMIDVGCRIDPRREAEHQQVVAKVQVVTPDSACLWCTGALDGRAILQEALSDRERRKLAAEAYYEAVDKQPSVISLTTLAASIAANKFLNILGTFGSDYDTRTQIELREWFMLSDKPPIRSSCVCQKRRGIGDSRRIV